MCVFPAGQVHSGKVTGFRPSCGNQFRRTDGPGRCLYMRWTAGMEARELVVEEDGLGLPYPGTVGGGIF